jgi:hypothetical protein
MDAEQHQAPVNCTVCDFVAPPHPGPTASIRAELTVFKLFAFARARLHCWRKHHGGRPALDTHAGRREVFCPYCGHVFWSRVSRDV